MPPLLSILEDKTQIVGYESTDIYCPKTGLVLCWSTLYLYHIIHLKKKGGGVLFAFSGQPVFIKNGSPLVSSRVTNSRI